MNQDDKADTDWGTDFRGLTAINRVCALGKEWKGATAEVEGGSEDEGILFKLNDILITLIGHNSR